MSDDLRHFDELVQRYIEGTLDDPGAAELMEALQGNPELGEELLRDLRMEALLRSEVPQVEEEIGRRLAEEFRRTERGATSRRRTELVPAHFWQVRRMAAAAAVLLIAGGLLALWLVPGPADSSLAQNEKRRQEILAQLNELKLERDALQVPDTEPRSEKASEVPPSGEPDRAESERNERAEAELAQRKKDAEECARLLEQQRLLLLSELDSTRKAKRSAESDEDPEGTAVSAKTAIATPTPVAIEAGCVVYVEGETAQAVLIRALEGSAHRTNLTAGTKIMRGDRIEVERGGQAAAASLQLQGGTTIDLAAKTALQVVDRNAVRLETGQIYACINRQVTNEKDVEYATSFSLQTPAARYLVEEARVEIFASPALGAQARTTARVDSGQVHVVNSKGHVMGRKGQEVSSSANAAPNRNAGFGAPIWRGRNLTCPGLPLGKGSPVLLSEGCRNCFCAEYALALAQTGELDLRGIQIVCGGDAPQGPWRAMAKEIGELRKTGLRFAPEPVLGATRRLQRPASGRYEDVVPERSPAVDQLLVEARKATPTRPLVVVTSGSLTDLASAWLIDHGITDRIVVVTDAKTEMWEHDPWAFLIVLERFSCVSCHLEVPANTFPTKGLRGTRWDFLAARTQTLNQDFNRFACVTAPGFVQAVERARFVSGPPENPGNFLFEPDPNGRTWLVKRTDTQRMIQEFEATFMTGSSAP